MPGLLLFLPVKFVYYAAEFVFGYLFKVGFLGAEDFFLNTRRDKYLVYPEIADI